VQCSHKIFLNAVNFKNQSYSLLILSQMIASSKVKQDSKEGGIKKAVIWSHLVIWVVEGSESLLV
jgi:hypothetical protein